MGDEVMHQRFEQMMLGREHPVIGWIDARWLGRGDRQDTYANDYVQGCWVIWQEVDALRKRARTAEREAEQALRTLKGLEKVAKVVDANSDAVCGENNRLRAELEALRSQHEAACGLLRVNQERLSTISAHNMTRPADWCSNFKVEIRSGIQQIDAFLTATTAPEVRYALSAENQRVVPPEPIIAPTHPLAALAEQGKRQEAVVMGRVHHNPGHAEPVRAVLNSIGRQLPDNAALYAEPPAQDVSGLVEALERLIAAVDTFRYRTDTPVFEGPIMSARHALAAYRKEPGK